MKQLILATCALCVSTGASWADNTSTIIQAGRNVAFSIQIGDENTATIAQDGRNNVAATMQLGDGHTSEIIQEGRNNLTLRIQATSRGASGGAAARYEGRNMSIETMIELVEENEAE